MNILPGPDSCWEWTGARVSNYGKLFVDGKHLGAHRFSYEMANGPIPEGLTIDHLCRNPPCVRPSHLEAVTMAVNLQRGDRTRPRNGEHNRIKTHCPQGHEYTVTNTGHDRKDGARYCRECKRLKAAQRRAPLAS